MPVIKGAKKRLEDENKALIEKDMSLKRQIANLIYWIERASPVEWIQSEDIQSAFDWTKEVKKLLSEKEVIGNDGNN